MLLAISVPRTMGPYPGVRLAGPSATQRGRDVECSQMRGACHVAPSSASSNGQSCILERIQDFACYCFRPLRIASKAWRNRVDDDRVRFFALERLRERIFTAHIAAHHRSAAPGIVTCDLAPVVGVTFGAKHGRISTARSSRVVTDYMDGFPSEFTSARVLRRWSWSRVFHKRTAPQTPARKRARIAARPA